MENKCWRVIKIMKVNIFYSWQSDLPNAKNRNLIEACLKKAIKLLENEIDEVSEISIESDSRNDTGTPNLVESIFEKIETCDILVADLSIINAESNCRPTPNPNVLLEVGFAAKAISWSNILCIYNCEYGKVELLPFDIRTRKPIIYNTIEGIPKSKLALTKAFKTQIKDIIFNRIVDKKEYLSTKRSIDLAMQSILIDLCDIVFDRNSKDKYNYDKLSHMSTESLIKVLLHKQFLGFFLYRNIEINIDDFVNLFNDKLETYFLNEKEKRILAKLVFSLRNYKEIIHSDKLFNCIDANAEYVVKQGKEINPQNPEDSYLLLKPIEDNKAVVIAGGTFNNVSPETMIDVFELIDEAVPVFAHHINNLIVLINDWIAITGKYFIINPKELRENN